MVAKAIITYSFLIKSLHRNISLFIGWKILLSDLDNILNT